MHACYPPDNSCCCCVPLHFVLILIINLSPSFPFPPSSSRRHLHHCTTRSMTRVRKNSEKRKAKSRDAARVRRSTESDIFSEISSLLPITCSQSMDKISIVRMAAAYLKTAGCLSENWNDWKVHDVGWDGSEVGIAVEGIPILVSADGSIAFVSEASDTLLGLNPLDLMGNLLYDYVHLCDHQELDSLLTPSGSGFKNKFIRLKTTLTSRGKRVNLSQATYRVCSLIDEIRIPFFLIISF